MYVITQEFDNTFLLEQCELQHETPQLPQVLTSSRQIS